MKDDPTLIGAEQPCTGQHGGHADVIRTPTTISVVQHRSALLWSSDSSVHFAVTLSQAVVGHACLGWDFPESPEDTPDEPLPHVGGLSLQFTTPAITSNPRAQDARIAAARDAHGKLRSEWKDADALTISQRRQLRNEWKVEIETHLGPLTEGRRPTHTAEYIDRLQREYLRRKLVAIDQKKAPSHEACAPACGETLHASIKRLRRFGTSWKRLTLAWGGTAE